MSDWFLKVLEKDITSFESSFLIPYCKQKKLPQSLSSLFLREEEENFPESINILLGNVVPKYLLYNSKSFLKWYKLLDEDFKHEVVRDKSEFKTIRNLTRENIVLQKFLKQKLGNDADVY